MKKGEWDRLWQLWHGQGSDDRYRFRVIVISNQGGVSLKPNTKAPNAPQSKYAAFKSKVTAVFQQLDIPVSLYAATEKDIFRKPRIGIWNELLEDYDIHLPGDLDLENSIFVGDAGGRDAVGKLQKDFSCSDRYVMYCNASRCEKS